MLSETEQSTSSLIFNNQNNDQIPHNNNPGEMINNNNSSIYINNDDFRSSISLKNDISDFMNRLAKETVISLNIVGNQSKNNREIEASTIVIKNINQYIQINCSKNNEKGDEENPLKFMRKKSATTIASEDENNKDILKEYIQLKSDYRKLKMKYEKMKENFEELQKKYLSKTFKMSKENNFSINSSKYKENELNKAYEEFNEKEKQKQIGKIKLNLSEKNYDNKDEEINLSQIEIDTILRKEEEKKIEIVQKSSLKKSKKSQSKDISNRKNK